MSLVERANGWNMNTKILFMYLFAYVITNHERDLYFQRSFKLSMNAFECKCAKAFLRDLGIKATCIELQKSFNEIKDVLLQFK